MRADSRTYVRNSQNYDILCACGGLVPIDLKNIIIFIYIDIELPTQYGRKLRSILKRDSKY